MKIPSDAIIPRAKLTQYLLVWREEDDKSRFLAQAGFTLEDVDALEAAIRQLIGTNDAVMDRQNEYGDYYRVEGGLVGVNGVTLAVITVWIVKSRIDNIFRFVKVDYETRIIRTSGTHPRCALRKYEKRRRGDTG